MGRGIPQITNYKSTDWVYLDVDPLGGSPSTRATPISNFFKRAGALQWVPHNVKHYGAVGDGVTDDSAAIQAALDEIKAQSGGKLTFPQGNYYIGNATLKWQAAGCSITIEGDAKYGGTKITANGSAIIFDFIGSDRCIMRDICIETSGACDVGILLARKVGAGISSSYTFDNVSVIGYFTKACVYSICSEVNTFFCCEIRNREDDAHSFYMSTSNDLAVVSDGGVISQFADLATNSVVSFIGGSIVSDGANTASLGIFGSCRAINIHDVYLFSTYRSIDIGPSIAETTMNGPIVIKRCSFEGTGGVAIYIGDVRIYGLVIKECLTSVNLGPNYSEVYQADVTPGRGIDLASISDNRSTAAIPMSFHSIFRSEVDTIALQLRHLGVANKWNNVQTIEYEAGVTDRGSVRTGKVDGTERRILLGPMPSPTTSDHSTYATLQIRPSCSDKSPTADDIGLIVPWNGQYASQPNPGPIYDKDSNFRPSYMVWTGYEYLGLNPPRKERYLDALPVDGYWMIGDMVWHLDAAIGEPPFWQCTTSGGAYLEEWAGAGTYVTGDRVLGSDGKVYEAIADGGEAEDPTTDGDNTYWEEEYATDAVFRAAQNL